MVVELVEGAFGGVPDALLGVVKRGGEDGHGAVAPWRVGDVVAENADGRSSGGVIGAREQDVDVAVEVGVVVRGKRQPPGGGLPRLVIWLGEHLLELLGDVGV